MKSLPPLVTGPTQWILKISVSQLNFPSKPKITLQWWGNNESDVMIYSHSTYTIDYQIKCSIKQFEDYCTDLGDLEFTLLEQGKKVGVITFSNFEVLQSPPVHEIRLPVIFKGKRAGSAVVVTQIVSRVPQQVVRHVSSKSRLPVRIAEQMTKDEPAFNSQSASLPYDNIGDDELEIDLPPLVEEAQVEYLDEEDDIEASLEKLLPMPYPRNHTMESLEAEVVPRTKSSSDVPSLIYEKEETTSSRFSVKIPSKDANIAQSLEILQMLEQRALELKERISKTLEESEEDSEPISESIITESMSGLSLLPSVPDVEELNLAKILNEKYHVSQQIMNVPTVVDRTDPASSLPPTIIEKLKKANQISVEFISLEMAESCVCPTVVWIEYQLPTNTDPIRFRTKISAPFKTPKTIGLEHFQKEFLTEKQADEIKEEKITVQITGLGLPKRAIGGKQIRNHAMQELWVAKGQMKFRDVLKCDLDWFGEIIIASEIDSKRFKPAEVMGYLKLHVKIENQKKEEQKECKTPTYFYIQTGICHGLRFHHDPPHDGTLVYLSMRLFKSDSKISTVPILWQSEFDKDTGVVHNPNSIDFNHTLPLALDQEFISKFAKLPILIEIHARASKVTTEKTLLGLVRVPFNQLFSAFTSVERFVKLPESDYPILDPFTGLTCGWIRVTLAIGSYSEIESIKVPSSLPEGLPTPTVHLEPDQESQEVDEVEDRSPTPVQEELEKTPMSSPKKSETVIAVTIHRACGLLGLVEDIIDQPKNQPFFEALDFATQTGTNPFVSLDIFPQDENSLEEFTSDTIQTHVVAYTFTPTFDYSIELTIESLDTDLLLWIKNGGKAIGRIWHRIPRHLCIDRRDQVCLGIFSIPLAELLTQQNGITNQWYSIGDVGAIQCSLQFKDGFDITSVIPRQTLRTEQQVELELTIKNIQLPPSCKDRGLIVRWKNPGNLEQDAFVSNCLGLKIEGSHSVLTESYTEKQLLTFIDAYPNEMLEISFYSKSMNTFYGSSFIKTTKLLASARAFMRSRNSRLGEPAFENRLPIIDPESDDLGGNAVWIRCEMRMIPKSRTNSESVMLRNDLSSDSPLSFLNEKSFEGSIMLHQSQKKDEKDGPLTLVSLHSSRMDSKSPDEEIFQKVSQDLSQVKIFDPPSPSVQAQVESPMSKKEYIPIYVTIEKALHLPLVDDPLANSFQSPFVKQSNLETTPPNASVAFKVPHGFKELGQVIETLVMQSQTSPQWNHEICLHLEKTVEAIDQFKKSGIFVFDIWSTQEIDDEFMSASKPKTRKQMLGSATVQTSPLFSGLDEIHGWYPVKDYGISKGQLMIRIHPTQDLPRLLMELKQDGQSRIQSRSTGVIKNNFQTLVRDQDTKLLYRSTIFSRSRDTAVREPISKPQDTWVWNGQQWIHKQLDLQPPTIEPMNQSILNKSISQTMDELDTLKQQMLSRLQRIELGSAQDSLGHINPSLVYNNNPRVSLTPLTQTHKSPPNDSKSRMVNSPGAESHLPKEYSFRDTVHFHSPDASPKSVTSISPVQGNTIDDRLPRQYSFKNQNVSLDSDCSPSPKKNDKRLSINDNPTSFTKQDSSSLRNTGIQFMDQEFQYEPNPLTESISQSPKRSEPNLFNQSPKRSEPDLSIHSKIFDSDSDDEDILAHRKSLTALKPPLAPLKSDFIIPLKE